MGNSAASGSKGSVRHVYSSGNVYEGEMKRNKRHGKGRYTWTDGTVYDGDWVNNEQHGSGVMTFPNGNKYEGEFKHNNPDGQGTLRTLNEVIAGSFTCLGRSGRTSYDTPVAMYNLQVTVSDSQNSLTYVGKGTLHLASGLLVLPNMPNEQAPVLPYATAVVAETGREMFGQALEMGMSTPSVSFPPQPLPQAVATSSAGVDNDLEQRLIDAEEAEEVYAEQTAALAAPVQQGGQGVLYGVQDPALEPKGAHYRSGKYEVFDPRNYF